MGDWALIGWSGAFLDHSIQSLISTFTEKTIQGVGATAATTGKGGTATARLGLCQDEVLQQFRHCAPRCQLAHFRSALSGTNFLRGVGTLFSLLHSDLSFASYLANLVTFSLVLFHLGPKKKRRLDDRYSVVPMQSCVRREKYFVSCDCSLAGVGSGVTVKGVEGAVTPIAKSISNKVPCNMAMSCLGWALFVGPRPTLGAFLLLIPREQRCGMRGLGELAVEVRYVLVETSVGWRFRR